MINRFNFYDVYGYLLPGLVLVTVLWLPFGIIADFWPSGDAVSALMAIPFAYVAGHVLQALSRHAFPPSTRDSDGKRRYPSEIVMDSNDNSFSLKFKEGLAARIKTLFNIDVMENSCALSDQRRDAFFLCRSALIKDKAVSYGEQFEGMYALMRGLAAVFLLGSFNYAGWAVAQWKYEALRGIFVVLLLVAGLLAIMSLFKRTWKQGDPNSTDATSINSLRQFVTRVWQQRDPEAAKVIFFSVAVALASIGYFSGTSRDLNQDSWIALFAAVAILFLALLCFNAYG